MAQKRVSFVCCLWDRAHAESAGVSPHRRPALNRPPTVSCPGCWARYGQLLHEYHRRSLAQSIGRAKGGGQSSKAKGRRLILWIAEFLVRAFAMEPDDVLVKATSQGGVDLHLSPALQRRFPFRIEGKAVEQLSIWQALKQAQTQTRAGQPPIVFFTRARAPVYVALLATDFIAVLGGTIGEKDTGPVVPARADGGDRDPGDAR